MLTANHDQPFVCVCVGVCVYPVFSGASTFGRLAVVEHVSELAHTQMVRR